MTCDCGSYASYGTLNIPATPTAPDVRCSSKALQCRRRREGRVPLRALQCKVAGHRKHTAPNRHQAGSHHSSRTTTSTTRNDHTGWRRKRTSTKSACSCNGGSRQRPNGSSSWASSSSCSSSSDGKSNCNRQSEGLAGQCESATREPPFLTENLSADAGGCTRSAAALCFC